jgi:hypothetical protein
MHYATNRKVVGLIPDRHSGPDVDSASNRNEYQESSWGITDNFAAMYIKCGILDVSQPSSTAYYCDSFTLLTPHSLLSPFLRLLRLIFILLVLLLLTFNFLRLRLLLHVFLFLFSILSFAFLSSSFFSFYSPVPCSVITLGNFLVSVCDVDVSYSRWNCSRKVDDGV